MNILTELKKQLASKNDFLENGPSTNLGQAWISYTKELLAKVDHGMSQEFDMLGQKAALPLSFFVLEPILTRMIVILRNAINYVELQNSPGKIPRLVVETKEEGLDKNIHRKYWNSILRELLNFIWRHKLQSSISIFVIILSLLAYLGYAKYIPEFGFPFGKFELGKVDKDAGEKTTDSNSKKLDRSVFDLAKEVVATGLTSQQRVMLISGVSGLETSEEVGTIEDIGTDGLTILFRGKSSDGSMLLLACVFPSSWKQRIFLLKKDLEIKFVGMVSDYDLSRQWINLKDCKLSN